MIYPSYATAPTTQFTAYAVATTALNTILKTSGAHTLYITDLVLSAGVTGNVTWNSATTAKGIVYLAVYGGMGMSFMTPLVLNSAESFTFTPSVSGSFSAFCNGYTVT